VSNDFRIAAWLVEPGLNTVSRNGITAHLEPKVMEVLDCLARHAGKPVSKEELLQTVWPNTFVTDDVLKRSISELRRCLRMMSVSLASSKRSTSAAIASWFRSNRLTEHRAHRQHSRAKNHGRWAATGGCWPCCQAVWQLCS